jgi:hypothetical protein
MKTIEVIFTLLIIGAIVSVLFNSQYTAQIIRATSGGTSQILSTITGRSPLGAAVG